MVDIVAELRALLGPNEVTTTDELRTLRRNWRDDAPLEALARVRPRSTEEVSRILRLCHSHGQTLVAHGGLTGHSEGDRTTARDLIVDLTRMNAIEDIDEIGRTVTVQAGCILQRLQEAVAARSMFLPLDLGGRGSCTIGGNVSTNAGGINVIRYGMARALVLGLEVVLPDGSVVSAMNRMLKNNTGYDLKQIFIGSEGTLGIVTRVVLALKEQPRSVDTVLVALESGQAMLAFLKHMNQRLGTTLSSFEAMWGEYFHTATAPGFLAAPLSRDYPFYVIAETQGADPESDTAKFNSVVEEALENGLIVDAVIPKSGSERARIWAIRESFEAGRQLKPKFVYDIGVPIRESLDYVEEVRAALQRIWPTSRLLVFGHLGDGNLHLVVLPGAAAATLSHADALERSNECVYPPLGKVGGAVSAEHGVGLEKKPWMPVTRSANEIELMRVLKRALDPKNILNRGKVVDV